VSETRAAAFAAAYAVLRAAHDGGDHVVQTELQSIRKTADKVAEWAPALAGHVGSYHAVQLAGLLAADRTLQLRLRPHRIALAVAWSAGTHALLDRRWPVDRILARTGHHSTAAGAWRSGRFTVDLQPLARSLTELLQIAQDALVEASGGVVVKLTADPAGTWPTPAAPIPRDLGETAVPLHGPYLADQALHHAALLVAAFIATGARR
jgi:hypothetical protein